MKIWLCVPLFLSLVLSSSAQTPQPCKSPPLLEGKLGTLVPGQKLRFVEDFAYDAYGQNVRVVVAGKEENTTFYADILLLFKAGISYEIFYHNKTCSKTALKVPFVPIQIPYDAHFVSQMVLGSSSFPGRGLLVNHWDWTDKTTKEKYLLTFTAFGCLPVFSVGYSEKWKADISTSFHDLVDGVEDPNVFIPPSFCNSVEVKEAKHGATVTSILDLL